MMDNADSSFRATPDAVHKLRNILQRIVENDGNILVAEEIWREEDVESKLVLEQARTMSSNGDANNRDASISVGNSRLSRLEDLFGAIDFLRSSLERRISDFRRHKPSRTITDLPDELLVLILDMAGGAKPSLPRLSRLSLVCKKFRRITISIPRLWARKEISSSMHRHVIDQLVGRSGTLGLCMKVKSPLSRKNAIFKYRERWTEITLDLTPPDFRILQERAPSTELPSLRKLSLIGAPPDPDELQCYFKFRDDWRPAALDSLHCSCTLPTGVTGSNITTFSLEVNNHIDMKKLKRFLSKTPLLENLSFVFRESWYGRSGEVVRLPLLKNFSFKSCCADVDVYEIFEDITFPNIATFDIDIQAASDDDDDDTCTCLKEVIDDMKKRNVHLEKLDLKVVASGRKSVWERKPTLEGIFSNVPESIQSFSLSVRNMELDCGDIPSLHHFDQLRSVRFNGCNLLATDFFKDLAAKFKDANILLDVLEVHHCRGRDNSKHHVREEMVKVLFRDAGVLGT